MFEIRQAEKSDIPDLVELDDECFDVYYYENTKFCKSDFEAYFRLKKPILLVAINKSHLVGYRPCWTMPQEYPIKGPTGHSLGLRIKLNIFSVFSYAYSLRFFG